MMETPAMPLARRPQPAALARWLPPLVQICAEIIGVAARAEDAPQWGQAWTRNQVSTETGLPASFDPLTGHNIRWTAALGTEAHSTPVIAGGRVYIGTNNNRPRDPKHRGEDPISATAVTANGVLYVATMSRLFAISQPASKDPPHQDPVGSR